MCVLQIMLDYAKNVYRVYKERPKFVFGFHGEISHDDYNLVEAADQDLLEWLQWFNTSGQLNNTLLIIMSDHGHRSVTSVIDRLSGVVSVVNMNN